MQFIVYRFSAELVVYAEAKKQELTGTGQRAWTISELNFQERMNKNKHMIQFLLDPNPTATPVPVEMSALQELRRGIQKELHQLIVSRTDVQTEVTEMKLYDFVVDFLKSDQMSSLENQGMSLLSVFNDLILELQQPPVVVDSELVVETKAVASLPVMNMKADRPSPPYPVG